MTPLNDDISIGLQHGDENIYIQLFRTYYVCLCAYSRKYVGRKDIAEEIVSEIFYRLWKNRNDLKIYTSIKSYLFKATYNNSIHYLRKERKSGDLSSANEIDYPELSFSPDELSERSILKEDFFHRIDVAVNNLPPQQREAFKLKRFEGKKNKEIADIMGIAVKTVEMHVAKALLKIRQELNISKGEFTFFILLSKQR